MNQLDTRLLSIGTRARGRLRPRGFNFAEVLFAVMILGIGFIMVAAIFPVALVQTKATMEETTAATIARGAVGVVQSAPTNALPSTAGGVVPVEPRGAGAPGTDLWDAIKGSIVLPSNDRYGVKVFYRRPDNTAYAQVIVIPVAARNQGTFAKAEMDTAIVARTVNIDCTATHITDATGAVDAFAPGAYLVVASDGGTGRLDGRILRITAQVDEDNDPLTPPVWEFAPGWEPRDCGPDERWGTGDDIAGLTDAECYVVGRGPADASVAVGPANVLEGPAQDIAAYTTFILAR